MSVCFGGEVVQRRSVESCSWFTAIKGFSSCGFWGIKALKMCRIGCIMFHSLCSWHVVLTAEHAPSKRKIDPYCYQVDVCRSLGHLFSKKKEQKKKEKDGPITDEWSLWIPELWRSNTLKRDRKLLVCAEFGIFRSFSRLHESKWSHFKENSFY